MEQLFWINNIQVIPEPSYAVFIFGLLAGTLVWGRKATSSLLDNVRSYRNRLDGIKGRKLAHNITIRNGESSESVSSSGF